MKLICWVVKVNLMFVCFMLHWVEGCLFVCAFLCYFLCVCIQVYVWQ